MSRKIEKFSSLIDRYRVFFFDAYGVLRGDSGLLPGVAEALKRLNDEGKSYWVVTNDASKTPDEMAARYRDEKYGDLIPADRNIGPGLMTRDWLRENLAGECVAYLGTESSEWYLREAGVTPLRFDRTDEAGRELDRVKAFVQMDEIGFNWEREINRLVNFLKSRPDLHLLAPNPDVVFARHGNEIGLGPGALTLILERIIGREFMPFGKPYAPIYDHAIRLARKEINDLRNEEILMVGDMLETDIKGARNAGIRSVLTLSGGTTEDALESEIRRAGVEPNHVVRSIAS